LVFVGRPDEEAARGLRRRAILPPGAAWGLAGRSLDMCYNCGCEMPDNDMGNPKNITNKTFEEAAKAAGQSAEEAKKNALALLQKSLGRTK
jgi:hypothetical protein